jgi:quercetin dioxygenase-like cupin family protein
MELHADLSRAALVHAGSLPWVPSPAAGVERRMLFRVGGEQAVATSIVRYAADSSFPSHVHSGGEEFVVLEGVFEDEHGRYPVGSYVRNPPGSAHAPRSSDGCVIFVRLRQFRADDKQHVFDAPPPSRHDRSPFMPRLLFDGLGERVAIVRWEPHSPVGFEAHEGLELLVLEGQLSACGDDMDPWSWLRLPPGVPLTGAAGSIGCVAWVKTTVPWPGTAASPPHFTSLGKLSNGETSI